MVGFEDVDFIIVHIGCMARNSGGSPQRFCEDGGLRAHRTTSENDGLFGVREEGEPGHYD